MAISWADVLEWETGPLDSIAADLGEVSQGLRSAHATGENALGAIQSEGLAVTMMRATTTSNLESLEQAATNVNDALMAIEGARGHLHPHRRHRPAGSFRGTFRHDDAHVRSGFNPR